MKIACTKRMFYICMVVLIGIFSSSIAWADFYVIASGKRAKKTVLVSPKSTETASGTALLNAMSGISDAGETNPYLIIIEPGVYNIGTNSLQMKSYVDIQGSGENVTTITGTVNGQYSGVLVGADNMEVRFITIKNTNTGTYTRAIINSAASPMITNVTATALGGNDRICIYNLSASPTMKNITTFASGGTTQNVGIYNYSSSSPRMTNVIATVSGGASSQNAGIYNYSSSPTMTNVTATASGEAFASYGVFNSSCSSLTMTNITATASAGTSAYGVYNNSSSPTMTNITATASAGTSAYGVYNSSSSPTMTNVTASASEATISCGVRDHGSSTCIIDHSVLSGQTAFYTTSSGETSYIGNTRLEGVGGVSGSGKVKCAGVYDGDFTFYPNTCP